MGIFDELLGNASEVDPGKLYEEFSPILFDGENIERGFKVLRDKWVFTNKRLIMVDIQGITGKKKSYHSIPYKAITHFEVETSGTFDADCELKIWVSGTPEPYEYELNRKIDVVGIQKTLAYHMMH